MGSQTLRADAFDSYSPQNARKARVLRYPRLRASRPVHEEASARSLSRQPSCAGALVALN
jgi:hypothetical protein